MLLFNFLLLFFKLIIYRTDNVYGNCLIIVKLKKMQSPNFLLLNGLITSMTPFLLQVILALVIFLKLLLSLHSTQEQM